MLRKGTESPLLRAHQLFLHIFIPGGTDEDSVLHQTHEAPESVRLIQDFCQNGGNQVGHPLGVANGRVIHCIVQQDSPRGDIQ